MIVKTMTYGLIQRHWGAGTLSLPFYPSMTDSEQQYVIEMVLKWVVPTL